MSKQQAEKPAASRATVLENALRRARAANADYVDAKANVSDLRFLRLDALREELDKITAGRGDLDAYMTLKAVPGDPPRLILDADSHVVMEPDPRTYAFVHDGSDERRILCETENRSVIEERIVEYIAHRIVERERVGAAGSEKAGKSARHAWANALLFWLLGVLAGGLGVSVYVNAEAILGLDLFRVFTAG